jgi:hypothetical protein
MLHSPTTSATPTSYRGIVRRHIDLQRVCSALCHRTSSD